MTSTRHGDVFHAVADPNRRAMLDLLADRERPVGEIVEHFELSFQGVSQHLAVLFEAGLVRRRKAGRFRYYRADSRRLKEIHDWVSRYEVFWSQNLDRLSDFVGDGG